MSTAQYWRGIVLVLSAATCWGLQSPIAKIISEAGISLMSAVVIRAALVVAILGFWGIWKKKAEILRPDRELVRFYGISGVLSIICASGGFLMSLESLSVAEALIVHYTFPLFTILGSLFIAHERPTRTQVLAGFLIVAGVYVGVTSGDKSLGSLPLPGLAWGVLSVFGISGQALFSRRFTKKRPFSNMGLLLFAHLFGGAILALGKTALVGWTDLANCTIPFFLLIAFQAVTGSLFAFGCFYMALKLIPAATVSLLCTLEIVVAIALSAVMLTAAPTLHEVTGCGLIIAAIVCTTLRGKSES